MYNIRGLITILLNGILGYRIRMRTTKLDYHIPTPIMIKNKPEPL